MVVLALLGLGLASPAHADTAAAKRHMARGAAAMEMANSPADYQKAINEFSQAVKQAPEWADAWFNLGVAQESAGDYGAAIDSFRAYLRKSPKAVDREAVETRIYKLEYKAEMAQQGVQDQQERQESTDALAGSWRVRNWTNVGARPAKESSHWSAVESDSTMTVSISGRSFEAVYRKPGYGATYIGTISGDRITGSKRDDISSVGVCPPVQFEGAIYYESNEIVLATQGTYWVQGKHSCRYDQNAFFGSLLLSR